MINKNVKFGREVVIYPNVSFEGNGPIVLEDGVKIGTNTIISAHSGGGILIGRNSAIAGNCYLIDCNHGIKRDKYIFQQELITSKLVIEEDVWVGANSTIGHGSHIKKGAVIGANSFVNSKIREYGVAVGAPAKVIKDRGE